MKRCILVLSIVSALVVLGGCKRRQPEDAQGYDSDTDPSASARQVTPDPRLADDQREVAREYRKKPGRTEAQPTGAAPRSARTPKEALVNLGAAIEAGDSDAFIACFDASEKEEEMLGIVADFMSTAKDFEAEMVKAYGRDSVKQQGQMKMGAGSMAALADKKLLDEATIKVTGDTATATMEGEKEPLKLVKKGGVWKVNVADLNMGDEKQAKMVLMMLDAMSKAMAGARKNIGKPDYDAKKINEEIRKAMMGSMMPAGMTPAPPAAP